MDEDMKNLPLAWNLDYYIDIFAKNKITLDCLGLLDQHMIKELIPPIGDRAIFTKNLENYNSITQAEMHIMQQDFGVGDDTNEDIVETINISDDIIWIKASSEPWKLLEEKWKKTTKYRQKEAENMSISEYMAQYPGLKKPTGYHLLCIDFDNMYPEAKDNLYNKFMLSKKRILELASTKFKSNASMNETIQSLISNLAEEHQDKEKAEEVENIIAFCILPLLTGQPMIKKSKKNCWCPSRQECRDGFITHVHRQMDLKGKRSI